MQPRKKTKLLLNQWNPLKTIQENANRLKIDYITALYLKKGYHLFARRQLKAHLKKTYRLFHIGDKKLVMVVPTPIQRKMALKSGQRIRIQINNRGWMTIPMKEAK